MLHAGIPDTWPALNSMVMDDENRLWISTIVDDKQVYEWWILNEFGELLATFRRPRTWAVRTIKNERLYVQETDLATGIQQIVAYRLQWGNL